YEAELPEPGQALSAVGTEGHGSGEGSAVEEIASDGAGRALEAAAAKVLHQIAGFAGPGQHVVCDRRSRPRGAGQQQIGRIERKKRRSEERGLGHAIVAIGERAKSEQELAIERVLKEEPATARRIRHAVGIEPGEEE